MVGSRGRLIEDKINATRGAAPNKRKNRTLWTILVMAAVCLVLISTPGSASSDGELEPIKIHTLDGDMNGRIDHIRIEFNRDIFDGPNCLNLDADDWRMDYSGKPVKVVNVYSTWDNSRCDSDAVIYLVLDEDAVLGPGDYPPVFSLGTGALINVAFAPDADDRRIQDKAATPALMEPFGPTITSDGARVLLLQADGGPLGGQGNGVSEAAFQDMNGDGRLDAVELIFSEPMDDSTFDPAEWSVVDHDYRAGGFSTGSAINDEQVFLLIKPLAEANAGKVYAIEYNPIAPGVKNAAGGELRPLMGASAISEVDRAPPVLDKSQGEGVDAQAGTSQVTLSFAEPVWSQSGTAGKLGALTTSDFGYHNGNTGTADQAAAIVSVTHSVGSSTVHVILDSTLSNEDIATDQIILKSSLVDLTGNAAAMQEISLSGLPDDTTPPGLVHGLKATAVEDSATRGKVKLEWTTSSYSDLASSRIYIREGGPIDAKNPAGQSETYLISAGVIGDAVTSPTPVKGALQSVTITGLQVNKMYWFLVVSVDSASIMNRGVSAAAFVAAPDSTAPAAVTDLEIVSVEPTNVLLKATVPSDNKGVTAFEIRHAVGIAHSDFERNQISTFNLLNTGGQAIATVPPAPSTIQFRVTDLSPETEYTVIVRAKDAVGLVGGHAAATFTTPAVTEPAAAAPRAPVGPLAPVSSSHPDGDEVTNRSPIFTWSAADANGTEVQYEYVLNQISEYAVTGSENGPQAGSTSSTGAAFNDLQPGTWFFHVRAVSEGGATSTERVKIVISELTPPAPPEPTREPEEIQEPQETGKPAKPADTDNHGAPELNFSLQAQVNVTRGTSENVLQWEIPNSETELGGVQIWRGPRPFELVAELQKQGAILDITSYTDYGAPADATYVVAFFELQNSGMPGDPLQHRYAELDNSESTTKTSDNGDASSGQGANAAGKTASRQPGANGGAWLGWTVGGVLLAGAAAAAAVLIVRRRNELP